MTGKGSITLGLQLLLPFVALIAIDAQLAGQVSRWPPASFEQPDSFRLELSRIAFAFGRHSTPLRVVSPYLSVYEIRGGSVRINSSLRHN